MVEEVSEDVHGAQQGSTLSALHPSIHISRTAAASKYWPVVYLP
jgi:hypothetical protein